MAGMTQNMFGGVFLPAVNATGSPIPDDVLLAVGVYCSFAAGSGVAPVCFPFEVVSQSAGQVYVIGQAILDGNNVVTLHGAWEKFSLSWPSPPGTHQPTGYFVSASTDMTTEPVIDDPASASDTEPQSWRDRPPLL